MPRSSAPSTTTSVVQSSSPWSGQQPYLTYGLEEARRRYLSDSPRYFPDSTVVPWSDSTVDAMQRIEERARAGSPLQAAANAVIRSTLEGGNLGGNPHLAGVIERAAQGLRPGIDAQFTGAGRYGSGAHATALADAYTGLAGDLAYRDYAAERRHQLAAATAAPELAGAEYADAVRLAEAGAAREALARAGLQDRINRFNFMETIPDQKLRQYMALVAGDSWGGTTTRTETAVASPAVQRANFGIADLQAVARMLPFFFA